MKTSEFKKMIQIMEHLIHKEIKKQLPILISEAVSKISNDTVEKTVINEKVVPIEENLKSSLKDLFQGVERIDQQVEINEVVSERPPKRYTKNEKWNQILNETTSDLRSKERMMGASAGLAFDTSGLINKIAPPPLVDGKESVHVPLDVLPQGASVLDVANHLDPKLKSVLTRNYSQVLKKVSEKKGRVV